MNLQLIKGQFSKNEAIELITKMINIKIRFQEDKIQNDSSEEDSKMRERRIKELQKYLFDARNYITQKEGQISIESDIQL